MYDELVGAVGAVGDYGGRRNIHMVTPPHCAAAAAAGAASSRRESAARAGIPPSRPSGVGGETAPSARRRRCATRDPAEPSAAPASLARNARAVARARAGYRFFEAARRPRRGRVSLAPAPSAAADRRRPVLNSPSP